MERKTKELWSCSLWVKWLESSLYYKGDMASEDEAKAEAKKAIKKVAERYHINEKLIEQKIDCKRMITLKETLEQLKRLNVVGVVLFTYTNGCEVSTSDLDITIDNAIENLNDSVLNDYVLMVTPSTYHYAEPSIEITLEKGFRERG